MTEPAQRLDETPWEVLIEQDPHGAASSFDCANSCRAPRTASSVNVGYARTISRIVIPEASDSSRNAIEIRVSLIRGFPPRCSGSATIHLMVPGEILSNPGVALDPRGRGGLEEIRTSLLGVSERVGTSDQLEQLILRVDLEKL